MRVGINTRRSRREPYEKIDALIFLGVAIDLLGIVRTYPGRKAGLSLIGVKGPGTEEMCNFLHVSLKQQSVGSMRGCSLSVEGIWLSDNQGADRNGKGDIEFSSLTQSLQ